jgi:photosystem II stability/assembly factor-like uncharacterized protein
VVDGLTQRVLRCLLAACALALVLPASAQEGTQDRAVTAAPVADLVFRPAPTVDEPARTLLTDITTTGERLVAVGASGLIITSGDRGASWQQASVPVSATFTAVDFVSLLEGWAVGHAGIIVHTQDGGLSWSLQFDGNRANQAFVAFTQERQARLEEELAALEESGADATLLEDLEYRLEDAIFAAEDAQAAVETGPADPFLDVLFLDASRGFAVGAYGMLFTTEDGGVTWQPGYDRVENIDRFHFYAIHRADEAEVFLAGEAGLLYRSDDGGQSFQRYPHVYEGSLFGLVNLGDSTVAYGLRGNLFRYRPEMDDWELLPTPNTVSLYGGGALGDGGAVLTGAGGTLLHLAPDAAIDILRHPSRSTLSAAVEDGDGAVWLVGMDGVGRLQEAKQ